MPGGERQRLEVNSAADERTMCALEANARDAPEQLRRHNSIPRIARVSIYLHCPADALIVPPIDCRVRNHKGWRGAARAMLKSARFSAPALPIASTVCPTASPSGRPSTPVPPLPPIALRTDARFVTRCLPLITGILRARA